ncbi:uncharacterized protein J4E87_009038 [Alternaria ethzedia]|uniref:uncharacterized protein n=1 Tax=Alternaria ethzedia TaxID=181014 RepID=UPI0020C474EF|nr:uncharacterized protein J4E87_009038 [Alternaria ethzedia]XP_051328720.1 uncharacterized protein J4E85_003293 [Alternaria conjuncta]KAI4615579.1 hypothetical protein J4E87_009038 [Alternaria ethzedia]KAI4932890.1 hypothetical protein J4E85_003293 [Alternaria conjuncta]
MPEYHTVYSERGRLRYLPDHLDTPKKTYRGIFAGRNRRPHRIHIAHVGPDPTLFRSQRRQTTSQSYFTEKLAAPRDGAKRFLRSFIDTHFSSKPETTDIPTPQSSTTPNSSNRNSVASVPEPRTADMRSLTRNSGSGAVGAIGGTLAAAGMPRPSVAESHWSSGRASAKSIISNVKSLPEEKPVASGGGVSVNVQLTEPVLFLRGFEQAEHAERSTAMLRGTLCLKISKPAKLKAVTLKFRGKATTKWPEGIPPKKVEFEEVDTLMSHTWPFFNSQFPTAENGTGADHVELYKGSNGLTGSPNNSSLNLTTKEAKRLSLQVNQSRSFGKGDTPGGGPSVAQKGYRTFNPGEYMYNFELPLDSHLPETIDVDLGSVKYELEATVERAGAFRTNLMGTKEVTLIRAPSEGSLEQVEPIAISRSWEDQLHYDIVISGKSFPLGAQVPIAFKLTPLAKVQCHRIKVFVTENVEYFCNNKRVHRMEPVRKVQLFEKRADGPPTSTFPGSTMRIVSGGGVPYDQRAAASRGEDVQVQDPTNLLGDLGGDANIGPTEMEFNVQLPSCHNLKEKDKSSKLHFDTTYQNIQVHHWIKLVMRLSKPDATDPTKRRHFEISIDSPFHILSCQATQANTALPAYSSPEPALSGTRVPECGCPNAPSRRNSPTSFVPTLSSLGRSRGNSDAVLPTPSPNLTRPQAAHIGGPNDSTVQRPIHLMRVPSFNPPAFSEIEPPPPLETPPPLYESIASPTSGLADYFSRLSDAYDDSDSDPERNDRARVEIPLTPGGRTARSMDERRTWLPVGH